MSDKIASIAPISGSPFLGFDNLPDSPISVIDFHGTDDDTIPYDANRYNLTTLSRDFNGYFGLMKNN